MQYYVLVLAVHNLNRKYKEHRRDFQDKKNAKVEKVIDGIDLINEG